MSEFIDGHRWPAPETAAAPADAPRPDDSDQRQGGGAADGSLPPFDAQVRTAPAGWTVALHFLPDHARNLLDLPLTPEQHKSIRDALIDVEELLDAERRAYRDSQLRAAGR